jgi:outer membrane protein assembly factor BamB
VLNKTLLGLGFAVALLAGCGERDIILPGERQAIRASETTANESRPISIPGITSNADWTHRGGSPQHLLRNAALPGALGLAFQVDIGTGDTRRARITADPVVVGGRIFTLDSSSQVSAVATSGALIWSIDVSPPTDRAGEGTGGGLAAAGGRLYVTTGFGELVVLDQATGGQIWRQDLNAPGSGAPTVLGNLVYVVGRDSRAWALDTSDGRIQWSIDSIPSVANFSGGAGVAATSEVAVFPFPSGEVVGAFPQGGLRRWSSVIAGERLGSAAGAAATDIAADPVIDGGTVYVGNVSGRVVAMSLATGDRLWTATEGATSPVLPFGGSVFLMNDLGELVRLDASDGSVIWRVGLGGFEETRERRQRTRFVNYGPILAGGRLIVASSQGVLRQFDPTSGSLLGEVALPGGAASHPVVAGGALYVVNQNGELLAFR